MYRKHPRDFLLESKYGGNDLTNPAAWKATLSELLASFLMVFLCGGIVTSTANLDSGQLSTQRTVLIAVTQGMTVALLIYFTMKVSNHEGGYFNPAITLSMLVTHGAWKRVTPDDYVVRLWKSPIIRALMYLIAQFAGATLGGLLIVGTIPNPLVGQERAGITLPTVRQTVLAAFLMEALLTFMLTFVVYGVRHRARENNGVLIIGLAYVAAHLVSFPLTGASFNPARTFGSAIVTGVWTQFWVYILAPLTGAVFGAVIFVLFFHRLSLFSIFCWGGPLKN